MSYADLDPLSPFTTVPSTWLAQLLANTEALHDGSGLADGAVSSEKLGLSISTDVNGWKVFDYGNHKVYKKRGTFSLTILASGWELATQEGHGVSLPSGISTIGASHFIEGSVAPSDPAVSACILAGVGQSLIDFGFTNNYAGNVTATVHYSLSITV